MIGRMALWLALTAAAASCASVPPRHALVMPDRLSGLGTEPFWNITLAGNRLTYRDAETTGESVADVARREKRGQLIVEGRAGDTRLLATFSVADCSDGMSDRRYPYSLTLTFGYRTLRVCAYPPDMMFTGAP